jgi:hypothetical protein
VVVETDAFDILAKGWRKPSVTPILDYVKSDFACLRVGDRRLCTRRDL